MGRSNMTRRLEKGSFYPGATNNIRNWTAKTTLNRTEKCTWKCCLTTRDRTCQGGWLPFYSSKVYSRAHFQEQFAANFLPASLSALPCSLSHKNSLPCWYMLEGSEHTGLRQLVCLRLPSTPSTLLRYLFILAFIRRCLLTQSWQDAFTHRFSSIGADGTAKKTELLCLSCSLSHELHSFSHSSG